MLMETWRAIPGFEGRYEVSDQGRVRSLDHIREYSRFDVGAGRVVKVRRLHRGRVLKPAPSKVNSGHLTVVLGRDGGSHSVHALVLFAFVGPCPPGHECCHSDDEPTNNRLDNLRWGTRSDNLHDAVRTGHKPVGEKSHQAKLRDADIPVIRSLFGKIPYAEIARRYRVSDRTIRQIKDGLAWRHIPC